MAPFESSLGGVPRIAIEVRSELLGTARRAIGARVEGREIPTPPAGGAFEEPCGAFVTLRLGGALRGCIGYTGSDLALARVVVRCALAAAFDDPRFPPVTLDELSALDVEISVLGLLEAVSGPEEIEAGRHGVAVEHGHARGLLLPQVATEHAWDAERLVAETCLKAGLSRDAWRAGVLFRFEAEVFGDLAL